jgi:hypothetical protein
MFAAQAVERAFIVGRGPMKRFDFFVWVLRDAMTCLLE